MAELAAKHLLSNGVSSVMVANRTFDRAVEVAERFNARPVSFDEIGSQLLDVDIVITSTASPEYVITGPRLRNLSGKDAIDPSFLLILRFQEMFSQKSMT